MNTGSQRDLTGSTTDLKFRKQAVKYKIYTVFPLLNPKITVGWIRQQKLEFFLGRDMCLNSVIY